MSLKVSLIFAAISTAVSGAALADEFPSMENSGLAALSAGPAYWTADRRKAAKERVLFRDGEISAQVAGTSNLDFTRSRVTPRTANTANPYKAAGKLFFTEPGVGDFQCSASIIKNRVIVTAAHCLFDPVVKNFFTNWVFIPAFDGGLSNPAGSQISPQSPFGAWDWQSVFVSATWNNTNGALPNNGDFGVIVLQDQSFSGGAPVNVKTKVGASFTAVTNNLFNTHVTILGYPCNLRQLQHLAAQRLERSPSRDHRCRQQRVRVRQRHDRRFERRAVGAELRRSGQRRAERFAQPHAQCRGGRNVVWFQRPEREDPGCLELQCGVRDHAQRGVHQRGGQLLKCFSRRTTPGSPGEAPAIAAPGPL